MASAGDSEIIIRLWDVQFLEEDLRHIVIVVLPGMHQHFPGLLTQEP